MSRGPTIPEWLKSKALDCWATMPKASGPVIAEALRITPGALNTIVRRARLSGDPRAVDREKGPVRGSSHRRVTKEARIRALDARGLSVAEISSATGCSKDHIHGTLWRARKAA